MTERRLPGAFNTADENDLIQKGPGGIWVTRSPAEVLGETLGEMFIAAALSNFTAPSSGTSDSLIAVTWAATVGWFVAVGVDGTIRVSRDGAVWESKTSGVVTSLNGVAASPTIMVIVGNGGVIRTSTDGATWTSRTSGTANDLYSVVWSSRLSLFVAIGNAGVIRTSPDGITWTSRTSGTSNHLQVLTDSTTLLVIGSASGDLLTSPTGVTWTPRTSGTVQGISSVAYNEGLFLGSSGYDLLRSLDGITWTLVQADTVVPFLIAPEGCPKLGPAGPYFVGCGSQIWITRDGVTWFLAATRPTLSQTMDSIWNGRVLVGVGINGEIICSQRLGPE